MSESRIPNFGSVIAANDELIAWFCGSALPLWDAYGVDRRSGGYFEELVQSSSTGAFEATGAVRRGRVVARQIYVFEVARRLGWRSVQGDPLGHGCDYLFSRLHQTDGVFHTAIDASTFRSHAPFDLYEQAFYLFALAQLHHGTFSGYPIAHTASRCLQQLRRHWGRAAGGFEESIPPSLPLRSNPHMHLLEAALSWIAVTAGAARVEWIELARELVQLCLAHFIDSREGFLREYFDFAWAPATGEAGRIVEPGHQFEWCWLLLEWASSTHCAPSERQICSRAALRLAEIGELGVDPARGVAVNELWDTLAFKDASAKLWPQTERLKAWCAILQRATSVVDAQRAAQKVLAAVAGMRRYFMATPAGLWHEVMRDDGTFITGPCKASSFYHVVCAIDVLRRTLGVCRQTMMYSSHFLDFSTSVS